MIRYTQNLSQNNKNEAVMRNQGLTLNPPKALYYFLFTLSGFSGLIYESIWTHYLKLFLGHAAYAQSLVLSIFMGGMAAGAWLAGRYSARWRMPILAYAVVEAVIGVLALSFHNSFVAVTDFSYHTLLPGADSVALAHLLKWTVAALLIIPQSVLLGMTFPLMTAGIIRRYPANSGATLALLYFTNSIGAAAGVLASGFWLIKAVGLPGAVMTAGLINILLALVVWIIIKLDTAPPGAPLSDAGVADSTNKLLLAAAFVTGMASFIYEIGWLRMLSLVLGSSTHAFELMLSAFITGLACGGLWIRKRIDSTASPLRFAAYVQIVMGLLALLTLPLYGLSFEWMHQLLRVLDTTEAGYRLLLLASHGIVLCIMLPTTFCAGMTLPLFTHALLKTGYGEKSIGRIYAFNTFGSIVGVLFAVNMLPLLGLERLIISGAAFDLALGIVLLLFVAGNIGHNRLQALISSAAAIVLGIALISLSDITPAKLASGVFRYMRSELPADRNIYYYRDGKTASISLYGTEGHTLTIATNGKPDASILYARRQPSDSSDAETMILLGAMPFGFRPEAATVAVIGMGSGMTTHTVLALPQVKQIDTIEIEPAVIEASRLFGDKVSRAHTDPRSRIHIEDAKTFFSLGNTSYDIIISEPSNPWVSGISSLFTQEFYRQASAHLTAGGVLTQWIHLYENNLNLLISVLKAIDANFSDYALYFTNNADILIIARNGGALGALDAGFLLNSGFKPELASIAVKTESDLRQRLIARKE
ncbi:MAG TPA: spermidine synthase, partial [Gammaproteobacteria bacterium]